MLGGLRFNVHVLILMTHEITSLCCINKYVVREIGLCGYYYYKYVVREIGLCGYYYYKYVVREIGLCGYYYYKYVVREIGLCGYYYYKYVVREIGLCGYYYFCTIIDQKVEGDDTYDRKSLVDERTGIL